MSWRACLALISALVIAGCGGSGVHDPQAVRVPAEAHAPNQLPVAGPGQLSGRIIYLTPGPSCQWRSYDLATGKDTLLSDRLLCAGEGPRLFSPDGRLVLVDRYLPASNGVQSEIVAQDGRGVQVGPTLGRANSPPGSYFANPAFSSDSTKITLCEYPHKRYLGLVADVASGKILTRVKGSCDLAFTQNGLAVLRSGVLRLGGRVLARFPASSSPRLAANQQGSLLVVTEHRKAAGTSGRYTVVVMTLGGHVLGRYHQTLRDIPFSPIQLSPDGRSVHVWWGCIQQLAPLDPSTHTFRLYFGESTPVVSRPSYSPDGKYAAMGQLDFPPPPGNPQPLDALVLDADTFKLIYRLPISAQLVAWVPA